jgi:hypothetical protein
MADNRSYVYRRLVRELGLTPAQAAGAVGGLGGESGRTLSPTARNPTSGALGIGQWLGGRARGVRSGDLRGQTDHLIAELKGPERGALNRLRSAHNINDATRAWVEGFERPSAAEISSSMPARLGYARDAFNAFHGLSGGGGAAPAGSTSSGGSTTTTTSGQPDFGAQPSALPLIEALTQSQQQAPPSASIQAPDFAAHAVMPAGFGTVSGGSGPAPKPDIGALAAAVKTLGGSVPQAGAQTSTDTPATDQPTADVSGNYPGMRGAVKFSPSADRPGAKTQPLTREFLARIAGFSHRTISVGTGTNHRQFVAGRPGVQSDHWTGQAADLPMPIDSKIGDLTAAHALEAAGVPWSQAIRMAQKGGVFNVTPKKGQFKGHRVQVLWKTMVGGNHHNHVHVGIR